MHRCMHPSSRVNSDEVKVRIWLRHCLSCGRITDRSLMTATLHSLEPSESSTCELEAGLIVVLKTLQNWYFMEAAVQSKPELIRHY